MIITDEKILRLPCFDAELSEINNIINILDKELLISASLGKSGLGLAAPQVGIHKNIAIIRVNKNLRVNLVNAKITKAYDKMVFDNEGCLSFPDIYEKTMRYNEILVEGNLVYPHKFIATGLFAVVIQHELDHLSGKLLPDVALPKSLPGKTKIRPNDLCFCKSGKKYKKCHGV